MERGREGERDREREGGGEGWREGGREGEEGEGRKEGGAEGKKRESGINPYHVADYILTLLPTAVSIPAKNTTYPSNRAMARFR